MTLKFLVSHRRSTIKMQIGFLILIFVILGFQFAGAVSYFTNPEGYWAITKEDPSKYETLSKSEYSQIDPLRFRFITVQQLRAVPNDVLAETTENQAKNVGSYTLQSRFDDSRFLLFTLSEDFSKGFSNCVGFKDRMHLLKPEVRRILEDKCTPFILMNDLREKYNQIFIEIFDDPVFSNNPESKQVNRAYFIAVTEKVAVPFIQNVLKVKPPPGSDEYDLFVTEFWQTLVIWRRTLADHCNDAMLVAHCDFSILTLTGALSENIFMIDVWSTFLKEKYKKEISEEGTFFRNCESGFTLYYFLLPGQKPKFGGGHQSMATVDRLRSIVDLFKVAANANGKDDKYNKAIEFYYRFNGLAVLDRGQATLSGWILLAFLRNIGMTFDLYVQVDAPITDQYTDKMNLNLYSLSAETIEEFHEYIKEYNVVRKFDDTLGQKKQREKTQI